MRRTLLAGTALFTMFFGAGNVVFPILLGKAAGSNYPLATIGFLIGGVVIPLIGLIAIVLYHCDAKAFFSRLGKRPGMVTFGLMVFLLGPLGSTPRLLTISYATLQPYLFSLSFPFYSALVCLLLALLTRRSHSALHILGYVLTPVLLGSLAFIIIRGLTVPSEFSPGGSSFMEGLNLGYTLLDLVAALLYAGLLVVYLKPKPGHSILMPTMWASLIAAFLLTTTYTGMIVVGARHASAIAETARPEEVLRLIAVHLLGPAGAPVACIAAGLACLTAAMSQVIVCKKFLAAHTKVKWPLGITLATTFGISLIGFEGIAAYLTPIMSVCYPFLLILSIINIGYALLSPRTATVPEL